MNNNNYYALKHPNNTHGEWSVTPKDYFDMYQRIPDSHANLNIAGMEEVMDHTYKTLDGSDGIELLQQASLEILNNPKWYFNVITDTDRLNWLIKYIVSYEPFDKEALGEQYCDDEDKLYFESNGEWAMFFESQYNDLRKTIDDEINKMSL